MKTLLERAEFLTSMSKRALVNYHQRCFSIYGTQRRRNDHHQFTRYNSGHVDFGGDVTRAMRAVDGCFILACAVEGPMPQTETVVRQALKEKVKPVLFINKVDRLINELQVTPRHDGEIQRDNHQGQQVDPSIRS